MNVNDLPNRDDRGNWDHLRDIFTSRFLEKTQSEWEEIYDGTDACVTATKRLSVDDNRPLSRLSESPGLDISNPSVSLLKPGQGAREALKEWIDWQEGKDYVFDSKGSVMVRIRSKI
jgi:alpha-methylacyl-CoA racemase